MTDTNGLLRAAGGERPKDDLLVERLINRNPCGQTLGQGYSCSADGYVCDVCTLRREAADEIVLLREHLRQAVENVARLRERVAALEAENSRLTKGRDIIEDRLQLLQRAEAERDAAIAARESIEQFSHMKTDEIERLRELDAYNADIIARFAEKLKQAEAERDQLMREIQTLIAERDALRQDAVSLLRRAQAIINRWQELYGEYQPIWLPPAHQVHWADDTRAFIDAEERP